MNGDFPFDRVTVRTPDGIEFSLRLASPLTRCFAWSIDLMVILAAASLVNSALRLLRLASPDAANAAGTFAFFLLMIGYGMFCEWRFRGQTFGKRLLRLRVVDQEGLRLRFSQVFLRNLLRAIDALPLCYLVGGAATLCDRANRRLGDLAAGTLVLHQPRANLPDLAQLAIGKYNSLRDSPHLVARLRHRVSADAAALLAQALLRRERLEAGARVALFAELAAELRRLVPFPEATTEGLPDEQYVRNVVEVLFARE